MKLFIDIETIPSQRDDARELVRDSIKPPATLKKPESIAAWWANEADAAVEEAYRRQALDGGLAGEIISIAVVTDNDREWVRCRRECEPEAELLAEFFDQVEMWTREIAAGVMPDHPSAWPLDDHYPVAHNAGFDFGFLWRRARVKRVPVPSWLPGPMARAGREFGDTMLAWAGYGNRVSLDALCRALGIRSPKDNGMDGSQVFDAWLASKYAEIEQYNLADAAAVAEVWNRLTGSAA